MSDSLNDRISRINRELDWVARPRDARIHITQSYTSYPAKRRTLLDRVRAAWRAAVA